MWNPISLPSEFRKVNFKLLLARALCGAIVASPSESQSRLSVEGGAARGHHDLAPGTVRVQTVGRGLLQFLGLQWLAYLCTLLRLILLLQYIIYLFFIFIFYLLFYFIIFIYFIYYFIIYLFFPRSDVIGCV
jgi:hypothetical protein